MAPPAGASAAGASAAGGLKCLVLDGAFWWCLFLDDFFGVPLFRCALFCGASFLCDFLGVPLFWGGFFRCLFLIFLQNLNSCISELVLIELSM